MKCRYCGSNNPPSGVLCIKCGRKLGENPPPANLGRPAKPEIRNPGQIPPAKKTAPLKAPSEKPHQNKSEVHSPLSDLASSAGESSSTRKTSAWELYPRTGSYFVLDMAKEIETGGKTDSGAGSEEEDSSNLLSGRYKIIKRLGAGGMSVVYLARDTKMETDVVIKEMSATTNMKDNTEYMKKRFDEEAKLLYRLHCSGIPKVTEFFSDNDSNYLVMEYVHGENLEKLVEAREIPVITIYEFVDWMGQLLETLIYLHSCDPPVIHRDIKPSNIMLNDDGDIILVDFGLAKSLSYFTSPQTKVGTRGYASPEHYLGKTSKASDIYSLGASFHYLLTHEKPETRLPFEFPPVSAYREDLGEDVDYIMEKMLEKTEKKRYSSAAEVLEDLNILSDFLAESYQGGEFSSGEMDINQIKESAKTGRLKKPIKPSPSTSSKTPDKASTPQRAEEKLSKKPAKKETELPQKEKSEKKYGTKAVRVRTRGKSRDSRAMGGKSSSDSKSSKPVNHSKIPDSGGYGDALRKSDFDNHPVKTDKNDSSKTSKYIYNGNGSNIESSGLSQMGNGEFSQQKKSPPQNHNKAIMDDEFADESFMEKTGRFLKILIILILVLILGAVAYIFGPPLFRKYVPVLQKPALQEVYYSAEPSLSQSAMVSVDPALSENEQKRDNLKQAKGYLKEG